ncbi:MAG TPA: DinB family protein [Gemmatimonadaceae bacterium]
MSRNPPSPAIAGKDDTARLLCRFVRSIYGGPAWHGPSVRSALRGVTAEQALVRIAPGRNSVWDLVLHVALTRHRVIGRIAGVTGVPVPRPARFPRRLRGTWWPELPEGAHGSSAERRDAWRDDRALLDDCQARLLAVLDALPAGALHRGRRGVRWSIADEIAGLAAHDAYHAGQIRLLLRLAPAARGVRQARSP